MREDINIKDKKIIVIILLIILCISVFGGNKIFNKKIRNDNQNNIKNKEIPKEQFAMYIKNASGNYDKYDGKDFPDGYKVNLEKSSCEDANGNIVNGAISTTNGKPTITSNKTIYCTFYMDVRPILDLLTDNSKDTLNETDLLQDELKYRYQGTKKQVTNNYICFGTNDKDECINNQDKYMYRIIGITKDGNMKLIKETSIGNHEWHSIRSDNISWPESDLFELLNGANEGQFLSTIKSSSNGINWLDLMLSLEWKHGATGYITSRLEIMTAENEWSSRTSLAKVGLIYLSDYNMSVTKGGEDCHSRGNPTLCMESWLNIPLNGGNENIWSWTMALFEDNTSNAINIRGNGMAAGNILDGKYSVSPVFYLKSNLGITGTGDQTNPYLIIN